MHNIFIPEILKVVRYKGKTEQENFKRFGKPFLKLVENQIYILPTEYANRLLKVYADVWEEIGDLNSCLCANEAVNIRAGETDNVGKAGKPNKANKT